MIIYKWITAADVDGELLENFWANQPICWPNQQKLYPLLGLQFTFSWNSFEHDPGPGNSTLFKLGTSIEKVSGFPFF